MNIVSFVISVGPSCCSSRFYRPVAVFTHCVKKLQINYHILNSAFLAHCVSASLLKGLKHANIVLLHDIIHTKETLTLVFEYVVS